MFHFKHFSLSDEHSAMKVGTDSVLLGSWVNTDDLHTILDIGTGSGLLALMMAQRIPATIDAIEVEASAADAARGNIILSPWADRIKVIRSSFQKFASDTEDRYDLIISNPPYFSNSLKAPDTKRSLARHDDQLSVQELMSGSARLLSPGGRLAVIIPYEARNTWMLEASLNGLLPVRTCTVTPRQGKSPNRFMAEFSNINNSLPAEESQMVIRDEKGDYTGAYKELTFDFYLGL